MTATQKIERFVVVALPRSGSTLTIQMLDDHPSVCCEGQIFAPRWRDNPKKPELLSRKLFPVSYATKKAATYPNLVYGFKLIFNEVFFINRALLSLQRAGWKFIFISRSNYLQQAISLLVARSQRQWHQYSQDRPEQPTRIHIDTAELLRELKRLDNATKKLSASIKQYSHFAINYETDLEDKVKQSTTLNRLCDYFSIPLIDPNPRIYRMHPRPIQNYIENHEEIFKIVRDTKYGIFCNDE